MEAFKKILSIVGFVTSLLFDIFCLLFALSMSIMQICSFFMDDLVIPYEQEWQRILAAVLTVSVTILMYWAYFTIRLQITFKRNKDGK